MVVVCIRIECGVVLLVFGMKLWHGTRYPCGLNSILAPAQVVFVPVTAVNNMVIEHQAIKGGSMS